MHTLKVQNQTYELWRNSDQRDCFATLVKEVASCARCKRMACSARILSLASGRLTAPIMFVGEAPGRLGADDTGIPFHGDKAGFNFEDLLGYAGISRADVFITNAVLCNPRDEDGNNSTPSTEEVMNCSTFLRRQIDLVKPKIVATLGATALEATRYIELHRLTLKEAVRTAVRWNERLLVPLYHPGQRAMVHRSMANQRQDYQFVADLMRKQHQGPRDSARRRPNARVEEIVRCLLTMTGEISYFSLHKIVYLMEYRFWQNYGQRLSGAYFIRQKDGPYCTDLHYKRLRNVPDVTVVAKNQGLYIAASTVTSDLFGAAAACVAPADDTLHRIEEFVAEQAQILGDKSEKELKTSAYMTRPMRELLASERRAGVNMNNSPIRF